MYNPNDENHAFQFNIQQYHANDTKSRRHTLIPRKGKEGRIIIHKEIQITIPFSPAAETVVNMLIGALTTRAKAMSSQSKYQWNDQEWEKIHRAFFV